MAAGRHKAARHNSVRPGRLPSRLHPRAVPAAVAALAVTAVMGATLVGSTPSLTVVATVSDRSELVGLQGARDGQQPSSRSSSRPSLVPPREARPPMAVARAEPDAEPDAEKVSEKPVEPAPTGIRSAQITGHAWMTADLNVWSGPGEDYTLLEVLPAGTKVPVTGEVFGGQWAQIEHEGLSRWVNADYLSADKPQPPAATTEPEPPSSTDGGLSSAPCASGSHVESGLGSNAVAVHRAVCAAFPSVSAYGGLRPGDSGEHGLGLALDIMVTGSTGDQIAEFVRANSSALGVSEVLWAQQIWTVERSSEGWRPLEDRGSVTANHYDHVHVTVYG